MATKELTTTNQTALDAQKTEQDETAAVLDSLAAELGDLMGDLNAADSNEATDADVNELIGEGEEA